MQYDLGYSAGIEDERSSSLSVVLEISVATMRVVGINRAELGYDRSEILSKSVFSFVNAESMKKVMLKIIYSKLSGRTVQYEVDLKNKNGTLETWRAQLAIRSAKIRIEAYPINDFACSNDGDQRASVRAPESRHTQTEQLC